MSCSTTQCEASERAVFVLPAAFSGFSVSLSEAVRILQRNVEDRASFFILYSVAKFLTEIYLSRVGVHLPTDVGVGTRLDGLKVIETTDSCFSSSSAKRDLFLRWGC